MASPEAMSRGTLINIALALLVGGLALFLYLRPPPHTVPELALSALDPEQVTRLKVERGSASFVLEKGDGNWQLVEPYRARADAFRVRQLLDLLDAKATRKLPATELARFDLDRPWARVLFNDEPIAFGTMNEMSNEQYVLTGDGVYLVPLRLAGAVPQDAKDLTGRQLFAADEELIEIGVGSTTLALKDGRWRLSPEVAGLSQDDLNRWSDDWKAASSLLAQKAAAVKAGGEVVTVKLKGGKTVRLRIVQREPELVLLREDEGLQYHFSEAAGKRLLTAPSAATS